MRKLLRRSWLLATVLLAAVVGAAYLVVPVEESVTEVAPVEVAEMV